MNRTATARPTRVTRVLLADDSDGLRLLVRAWLSTTDDLEVVAEASNGAEALVLADAHRPDVVVLDVAMPVMDGLEALTELHRRHPRLPVVMLSGFAERDVADQARRRGAFAFVEKSGDLDPLVDVVRRAAAAGPRLPQPRPAPSPAAAAGRVPLSPVPDLPAAPGGGAGSHATSGGRARSWLPTALALAAFPVLLLWHVALDDPHAPVLHLLALPILVLAARHGLRAGLGSGAVASALFTIEAATAPEPSFAGLDHVGHYVVFLSTGAVAGLAFERLHRAAAQQREIAAAVVTANRRLAEANEELAALNAELQGSNAELRQFGYVVSHDLAEPLRTMSSFAHLLETRCGDRLDDDGRRYVRFVLDGAERLQALVADLRDYTRTGSADLVPEPVALDVVLADVRAALRATLDARGAVLRSGPLPVVSGDRSMLGLVLQNLVSNAVKFNVEPVPTVEVDAVADGSAWQVRVADNGIGVDPAGAERAFALFARLHPRDAYPGTGLGLAICRRIVERHRGTIQLGPRPGGGTVVTVTLPAAAPETP